jgi:hypothetical protein
MRKIIPVVAAISLIFCGVSLAKKAPDNVLQGPFAGWAKLDAQSKILWKDIVNVEMEVFIRTNVPAGERQKEALKGVGFKYRSVIPFLPPAGDIGKKAGSIVTGTVPAYALKDLAVLPFVEVIEGAVRVTTKTNKGGK